MTSLRPTATLVVSSSSRSPKLGTGRACSQAPDSLCRQLGALRGTLHLGHCQLGPRMLHRSLTSPTFSDDGLLGQEGVDCHAFASMCSKPQPWQHRVLPVGALRGCVKQGRRSQQQMLGKQKVQAVLHPGCQDPLGSRPCLNRQEGHWLSCW